VKFEFRVSGQEAVLRLEQRGDPVDVPVTVTITYANGQSEETILPLAEKVTERTITLRGAVRSIAANTDNGALVEIEK
jgi:hypothetical protein